MIGAQNALYPPLIALKGKIWYVLRIMIRKYFYIIVATLMTVSVVVVCRVFDTDFANSTIDWLSFAAAGFIILEAYYKLHKFKHVSSIIHAARFLRILIGLWIFAIHMIQFLWGANAPFFDPLIVRVTIDWSAFFFGMFLVCDGVWSIHDHYRSGTLKDQTLRLMRTIIGTCIVIIHILQFIRDY